MSVWYARWARRLACPAAQAAVDVRAHIRVVHGERAFDERVHEDDPTAGAVVLILETEIRRTCLQAEAAMHARIDARARVGERRAGNGAGRGASSRGRHAAGPRMPGFNTRSGSNVCWMPRDNESPTSEVTSSHS